MIRNALPADWPSIRDLCCRTGNAGEPIDSSRHPFFGEFWIGPYERLRPEWTYVATDDETGERLGYLTGCPDTVAFDRARTWRVELPLFARLALGAFPANGDTRRFRRRFLGLEASPERRFPQDALRELKRAHPAHLHINLEAAARGKGVGRALVDRYRADLTARGIRGVHLFCGPKPLSFYEKVGFRTEIKIEFRPGVWVYALGSRF